MILRFLLITLVFSSWHTYAQESSTIIDRSDTLKTKLQSKTDSLKAKLSHKTAPLDTLKQNVFSKPEELQSEVTSKIDSLDQATLGKIEKEVTSLNQKLDSLQSLQLPSGKYKQKADSLYNGFQQELSKYKLPGDSISPKVKERITSLDKTLSEKTSLIDSLFTANGLDMNFNLSDKFNGTLPQQNSPNTPGITDKLPALTLPEGGASIPDLPMPNASMPNAQAPAIPKANLPTTTDIPGMDNLQSLKEKVSDATAVVKDAEGYTEELKKVQEMDVQHMEKIPEVAEKQLMKIDEMGAAQSELSKAEALKKEMGGFGEQAKNPEEMKEEVMHRTKQPFVDYLEGKDEKVKSGMNKMFDYQKKYRTVADTRFLPKRMANKMKDKPWQERLVPGYFFQLHPELQPWTGIDISPFIGYRLSGRFRTFIGGTYRLYVNVRDLEVNTNDRAYAIRWFTHVKTINGIYVHLEAERKIEDLLNVPLQSKLSETKFNVWQNHYYAGLMRLQRINKKINASFYAIYSFDNLGKTFNVNQITLRFGLEYKLKKKKKADVAAKPKS